MVFVNLRKFTIAFGYYQGNHPRIGLYHGGSESYLLLDYTVLFADNRCIKLFIAFAEGADGCENELLSKYPIDAEIRIRERVFCVSQALIKQQHMPLYLLIVFNSHCWIKNEMKT